MSACRTLTSIHALCRWRKDKYACSRVCVRARACVCVLAYVCVHAGECDSGRVCAYVCPRASACAYVCVRMERVIANISLTLSTTLTVAWLAVALGLVTNTYPNRDLTPRPDPHPEPHPPHNPNPNPDPNTNRNLSPTLTLSTTLTVAWLAVFLGLEHVVQESTRPL